MLSTLRRSVLTTTKTRGETAKKAVPGVVGRYPTLIRQYRNHRANEERSRKEAWRLNDLHYSLTGRYITDGGAGE